MTIQYVNTGSGANSGDGDSLRTAFYKINNNFAELSAISGTDTSVIIINSFPPNTSTEGTIWFDTVSGRNFIYYDGFWVDAAPPAVEPINLTTVTSHILPGANLTYDLGSTSSQWRSLYVGSSTIYVGGTPLSISNGRLTVNGVDSATTSSLKNNGSSLSIDSTGTTLFLPSANGVIRSFNNISGDGYGTSIIEIIPDFQLARESDNHQYLVIDPSGGENHIHIRSGGNRDQSNAALWLGGRLNHVIISDPDNKVKIGANNGEDEMVEWEFTGDGKLSLPTVVPGIAIDFLKDSPDDHVIRTESDWRLVLQARATYPNDGHLELEAGQNTKILIHGDGSNIDFIASDSSTTQTWTMNLSGELVFPDGSVQTSAATYASTYTGWFQPAETVVQLDTLLARIASTGTMQISSTIVETEGQGAAFAWNGVRNQGATMSAFGQGGTNWVMPGSWLDISATPLNNNFEVATVSVFKLGGTGSLYRITYVGATNDQWSVVIERVAIG
jgi:hypothetical protein